MDAPELAPEASGESEVSVLFGVGPTLEFPAAALLGALVGSMVLAWEEAGCCTRELAGELLGADVAFCGEVLEEEAGTGSDATS